MYATIMMFLWTLVWSKAMLFCTTLWLIVVFTDCFQRKRIFMLVFLYLSCLWQHCWPSLPLQRDKTSFLPYKSRWSELVACFNDLLHLLTVWQIWWWKSWNKSTVVTGVRPTQSDREAATKTLKHRFEIFYWLLRCKVVVICGNNHFQGNYWWHLTHSGSRALSWSLSRKRLDETLGLDALEVITTSCITSNSARAKGCPTLPCYRPGFAIVFRLGAIGCRLWTPKPKLFTWKENDHPLLPGDAGRY